MVYLGSIGAVYLVPEMMALFAELTRLRSGAVFLLVCNNGREEVEAAADTAGIPPGSLRIVQAAREEIPGLIAAADNANQLQAVIAHELGHVAGGHAIRIYEGEGAATKISILSLVLAAAAAAARGSPPRNASYCSASWS